jgi:hydrogenase nickel incorporation protein HypA/HybF
MHELSICQALIEQVTAIASYNQATQVINIKIAIGDLSGVEAELLERAFAVAKINSIAARATLVITKLPIKVKCLQCHEITEASINKLLCKHCGDWHTEVISGNELLLSQIELQL